MKIIQLISIKFEMKNIGIIVYGRFPTEKAYGSHIIDIADGFLENNCNVNVFYSKTSNKKTLDVSPQEYYENKTKFNDMLGQMYELGDVIDRKEKRLKAVIEKYNIMSEFPTMLDYGDKGSVVIQDYVME